MFVIDTDWTPIWNTEGDSLEIFIEENDVYFKQVMIPITDTNWLKKDFQFRFMNFASLSAINSWQSNTDHWHIDMDYLNINRSADDIYTRDVSFSETPHGFLLDYSSMPFWQYSGNSHGFLPDPIDIYIHNLDSVNHTCNYSYYVLDENDEIVPNFNYPGYSGDIIPFKEINTYENLPFIELPVLAIFPSSESDSLKFKINHVVFDEDSVSIGDTIVFNQEFNNYFAYDDGTAEAGYGLTPAGARLAYKFETAKADTLRGVRMFFNKTVNNENNDLFHIGVWNDNNGVPGNMIYKLKNQRPEFNNGLNKFHTYI